MSQYEEQWRRYRRLVAFQIGVFAGTIPFTMVATVLSEKFLHADALVPYFGGF